MKNDAALLVVDVQVGMFEGPAGPVYGGEGFLERLGDAIGKAREAGVPVVFVQHCDGPGEPLEADTPGWEIHPKIAPQDGEPVVRKRTPDSFHETTLEEELGYRNVGRLVLTGAQTDHCVDATCRRASTLGYEVMLVEDGHSTWDTDESTAPQIIAHHNGVLGEDFARLVKTEDLDFAALARAGRG